MPDAEFCRKCGNKRPSFDSPTSGGRRPFSGHNDRDNRRAHRQELIRAVRGGDHFESVMENNHEISLKLRDEVDDLHKEMETIGEATNALRRVIEKTRQEDIEEESWYNRLSTNVVEAKARVNQLKDHRRALSGLSVVLRRDSEHLARKVQYLHQMAEDEEHNVQEIRTANLYMERSCRGLLEHTSKLEEQHRSMATDYQRELEARRNDERLHEELTRKLEQLRREYVHSPQGERRKSRKGSPSGYHQQRQQQQQHGSRHQPNPFDAPRSTTHGLSSSRLNSRPVVGAREGV